MTAAVAKAYRDVAEASDGFERRWTIRAILTHDKELYARFRAQQDLWCEALVTGDDDAIRDQTAAMCRGWAAITTALDTAGVPDDAYLVGRDDASGVTVAISDQKPSRRRVEELYGDEVIFITPAEVATLLARSDTIRTLKGWFPGSELIGMANLRRDDESHP